MEERLKGLNKSIGQSTFKQLKFTEKHREKIYEKINKSNESEDHIVLSILQLLKDAKTGYELMKLLRSRGIKKFEGEEGLIYTLLHRLEQSYLIQAEWDDQLGAKYYHLDAKGKKLLSKAEKSTNKHLQIKVWIEV
ncbi:PadR family transcriptional regulator [Oceanobacillus sp. CAU 1775]